MNDLDRYGQKIMFWRDNPLDFVRTVFQAEPQRWQELTLNNLPKWQRLAMRACKGPGKTTILAWAAWWFLLCFKDSKVIATSITADNLKDGLWSEMSKWQQKSEMLVHLFQWNAERIVCKQFPQTWFASARTWPKEGDATQQANALAGIHSDSVLFVLDEVGDYPEGVFAAAEGALSTGKNTKLLVAGNPTQASGPLYRICTKDRALWYLMRITGDPDDPERSPRVSVDWARQVIAQWGKESNFTRVNVFAEFPASSSDSLISLEDAENASRRMPPEGWEDSPRVLGVDVARYGNDRSTIVGRMGPVSFKPKVFRELNTMELAGQVVKVIADFQPDTVFVDATGIGAGVVDRLGELARAGEINCPVVGVDFGSASLKKGYKNRRAQMWGEMGKWIQSEGCIPDSPELISELCAASYRFDSAGRMVLTSKEEMKSKGIPSPDEADGLALTFAQDVHRVSDEQRLRALLPGQQKTGMADYEPSEHEMPGDYDPMAEA